MATASAPSVAASIHLETTGNNPIKIAVNPSWFTMGSVDNLLPKIDARHDFGRELEADDTDFGNHQTGSGLKAQAGSRLGLRGHGGPLSHKP